MLGSAYADERVSQVQFFVGRAAVGTFFLSLSLHIVFSSQKNFNETRKSNAMETTHALVLLFVFRYKLSELWLSSRRQPIKEKRKKNEKKKRQIIIRDRMSYSELCKIHCMHRERMAMACLCLAAAMAATAAAAASPHCLL